MAYDFCVSEHTYELTQRDERLKKMVVETAIEAVNRASERAEPRLHDPEEDVRGAEDGSGRPGDQGRRQGAFVNRKATSAGAPGGRAGPRGTGRGDEEGERVSIRRRRGRREAAGARGP